MSMPTSLSTLATTPAPRRVVALTILMVARVRTRPLAPRPGEGVNLTPWCACSFAAAAGSDRPAPRRGKARAPVMTPAHAKWSNPDAHLTRRLHVRAEPSAPPVAPDARRPARVEPPTRPAHGGPPLPAVPREDRAGIAARPHLAGQAHHEG